MTESSQRLERIARAHDALAPTYDATLAENPVAVWMRTQLWAHYARAFPPGGRVLDIAAGTGTDALHLAERGMRAVAIDVSSGMIDELQRRASERGLAVETHVIAAEHLSTSGLGEFDGALTAFAGLNTIDNLPQLSTDLARLLKPRGRVIIHALNSFCLWETVNGLLHGHVRRARTELSHIGGEMLNHRAHDPVALWREVFAADFDCREMYALSVIAAPTWLRRAPRMTRVVLKLDGWVGRLVPNAGDFFVLDLLKRG
jgi:ubiquinone/menaquinone biosynthesis C-methylase UbiE